MITPAMIYWIGILDEVKESFRGSTLILLFFALFTGFFLIITTVGATGNRENEAKKTFKKSFCIAACLLLLCSSVSTFLPSSRLAAAMYMVPAIANNEDVQAIGSNSIEALRLLTEDWLRDLADVKKDSKISQESSL